jgi:putative tricarboxylic transport membrane protein
MIDVGYIIANVFSISNLAISLFGVFMGILFGALPGFTTAMGVAVLLPVTFTMHPASALILLGGVFVGGMYGGAITAILINTPGTPAAAATVLDGYPLAQKGKAREALQESVIGSFFGGIFSVFVLLFLAPPLSKISLAFGPPEYLLLAVFGLTIIASISEKSMVKGIVAGLFGLILAMVGTDPLLGVPRFTMGFLDLVDGVELVPALIGLFAIPEVLNMINSYDKNAKPVEMPNIKNIKVGWPTLKHFLEFLPIYIKTSLIGTFIGILPGAGGSIASFVAYNETKRTSKHPELFGHGSEEGVAASETSNNAVTGGALIPMLTLGIPGDSVAAIMMGALMIHGLQPGADLFTVNGNIVYTFIIALFVANIFMLLFGIYCAPYFTYVTSVPKNMLAAFIVLLTVIGAFALRATMFDVYVMLIFGLIGAIMKYYSFDIIPIVLGLILGKLAENGFNQTLSITSGSNVFGYIFTRPICIILTAFIVASIALPPIRAYRDKKAGKVAVENPFAEDED